MNQSKEKWKKPHFYAFLRGLRGIRGDSNYSKQLKKLSIGRYYLDINFISENQTIPMNKSE